MVIVLVQYGYYKNNELKTMNKKILLYDIETSYTVGAVWGLYDQNVASVLREPYIISIAWKWLGDKTTHTLALPDFPCYKKNKHSDKELVSKLWELFNQADVIVAQNGNSFDQKWTYGRFIINGLKPPTPSKYVDTKLVAKSKFKFLSNSLSSMGKYLNVGDKLDTGGIELWVDCIENNKKSAWDKMKKYNKQDVILLEKVYLKLLPYITNHPNIALMNGDTKGCPNCGSIKIQKRGFAMSRTSIYQRWHCQDCGAWHQSPLKEGSQIR